MINELHDAEIFENDDPETVAAVVWYLVHLLGGSVRFPLDGEFAKGQTWLTLHREGDSVVLTANQRL